MSEFRHDGVLDRVFKQLQADLLREGGPQISVTRNYNFAIVPYDPGEEFDLRRRVSELAEELRDRGWVTDTVALNSLLLSRLKSMEEGAVDAIIAREKRLAKRDPKRALAHLSEKVVQLIEGPDGIAADVAEEIQKLRAEHPDKEDQMVVFVARAGSLYPFFRTSTLLKHIAERTGNVPVVLLYPGHVVGDTGLSFMGKLPADRDYRPRIYR